MAIDGLPQDRPRLADGQDPRPRRQHLSISEVLGQSWSLYTTFLGRFVAIAAIVFAVLSLVQFLSDETREFGLLAISIAATIVGIFWLQGALVVAVDDARKHTPALSIQDIFRRVLPHLWTLIGAGLLVAIGVGVGLVLLVVPGLVLLTFWSMATPAIVIEGKSVTEALSRSWSLVRGDALRVFAVIAITVVLAAVFSTVIGALLQPLPDAIDGYVASVVASAISVPFVALAWTVMYFELRLIEGTLSAASSSR